MSFLVTALSEGQTLYRPKIQVHTQKHDGVKLASVNVIKNHKQMSDW